MGFWDKVTGGSPAAMPQMMPAYPQTQPWFQQGFPQTPQPGYPQQGYQPQGYPQPSVDPHEEAARRKAKSARSTQTCPDCGSDNIFRPDGMPNMMTQCYECGWNPRFGHTTAGAGMPSTAETGPAQPARQISKANNFNPHVIVGTVNL